MRVAFIVPSLGPSEGQGRANLAMLRAVAGAGHEVDVVAGNVPDEVRALAGVRRVRALPRLPAWQLGNQLLGLATSARLLDGSYDLVHADAAITTRRADVLAVHTVTACWLDLPEHAWRAPGPRGAHEALATRLKARIELRHARRARAIVANSRRTADDLTARGIERERITVVPFGVDARRYHPATLEGRSAARAGFGIEPAAFVCAFVGALGPRKGFSVALEALAGTGMVLLAAGERRGTDVDGAARASGVRAVLPGKLADVRAVYRAADVFIYPSRYDAFGLAVLEAMACGVPVLVSPETGAAEVVGDGGIVLEETAPDVLRAGLTRIRDDDALRRSMAERAREIAAARPWDETGATLLKLYRGLR